ncbi:alpha/beta fold hydrolase [Streptomyces sp. NPDC051940]|uniref:alpha/beta fold hydrolase n=1 Tax=Streptomyces sp. NPDC051940 TaxID=3155675 RepID=UPI0034303E97
MPTATRAPARPLAVLSADGTPLHAELHGPEGTPAVVLVHGLGQSAATWSPVIDLLAADHLLIAYDVRGHGRTPAGPGGPSARALTQDLTAVLTACLGGRERAVLAGLGLGAATILAAVRDPLVRAHTAGILNCPTPHPAAPLAGVNRRTQHAWSRTAAALGAVTPAAVPTLVLGGPDEYLTPSAVAHGIRRLTV